MWWWFIIVLLWNLDMLQASHTQNLMMVHFLTKVTPPQFAGYGPGMSWTCRALSASEKNMWNESVTCGFRCAHDFVHVTGYAFDTKMKMLMSLVSYTWIMYWLLWAILAPQDVYSSNVLEDENVVGSSVTDAKDVVCSSFFFQWIGISGTSQYIPWDQITSKQLSECTVNAKNFSVTIFHWLNFWGVKLSWVRVAHRNYCC